MWSYRRPWRHRRGHDVDGILFIIFPGRGTSLAVILAIRGRKNLAQCVQGCKLTRHQYVCGLEAVERIEVGRGVECTELLAFLEEFAAGYGIKCEGR